MRKSLQIRTHDRSEQSLSLHIRRILQPERDLSSPPACIYTQREVYPARRHVYTLRERSIKPAGMYMHSERGLSSPPACICKADSIFATYRRRCRAASSNGSVGGLAALLDPSCLAQTTVQNNYKTTTKRLQNDYKTTTKRLQNSTKQHHF